MNLRVLVISTALITAIFLGFVIAFLYQTPPTMDGTDKTGVTSHPVQTIPQEGKPLPSSPNPGTPADQQ
jgi:hypothetical protein